MKNKDFRTWGARLLIGLVLFVNVQCALAFLFSPEQYAPGFDLQGASGRGVIQGMGILFMMWSVPYAVAFSDPISRRTSLFEAVTMQAIGLAGEAILLLTFAESHSIVRTTVSRFITFDGTGLALLLIAVWLVQQVRSGPAVSTGGKI